MRARVPHSKRVQSTWGRLTTAFRVSMNKYAPGWSEHTGAYPSATLLQVRAEMRRLCVDCKGGIQTGQFNDFANALFKIIHVGVPFTFLASANFCLLWEAERHVRDDFDEFPGTHAEKIVAAYVVVVSRMQP